MKKYKIAVAGTGYVGLSLSVLPCPQKCISMIEDRRAVDAFFKVHHDYRVVHLHSSSKNYMPTVSRKIPAYRGLSFYERFLNYLWCIKPKICRKFEMFDKSMVLGVVMPQIISQMAASTMYQKSPGALAAGGRCLIGCISSRLSGGKKTMHRSRSRKEVEKVKMP